MYRFVYCLPFCNRFLKMRGINYGSCRSHLFNFFSAKSFLLSIWMSTMLDKQSKMIVLVKFTSSMRSRVFIHILKDDFCIYTRVSLARCNAIYLFLFGEFFCNWCYILHYLIRVLAQKKRHNLLYMMILIY